MVGAGGAGADGPAAVGAGGDAGCSEATAVGVGAAGAAAVAAGGVAGGAVEGVTAVGAGGGPGCSEGNGVGVAVGAAAVEASDVDGDVGVVKDGAVGSADTFVPGGADRLLKRESSWLATSNRPSARTTTDRATQLVLILTA